MPRRPASKTRAAPPATPDREAATPPLDGGSAETPLLSPREAAAARTRAEILSAGLATFAERGFAATRLDEVASRAGVAKGTIYVHFKDKETLFEQVLVREASPLIERIELFAQMDAPIIDTLRKIITLFRSEVLGTQRAEILRLILTEGARFPHITEFHYREVISRVLDIVRRLLTRAYNRGEIASDAAVRFPQLVIAPLLMSIIWQALFARHEPLDVDGLLDAHLELLTGRKGDLR